MHYNIWDIATQPVSLWTVLGGKPKWFPLNFGFNDVMCTDPIVKVWCYEPAKLKNYKVSTLNEPTMKPIESPGRETSLELNLTSMNEHSRMIVKLSSCHFLHSGGLSELEQLCHSGVGRRKEGQSLQETK